MLIFKQILITPDIARHYLSMNTTNRRISDVKVAQYVRDILNDRWKSDTAECIKFSKSGKLIDGQHRLTAIVKANTPVSMCVVDGLGDDVFSVLDTGKSRNAGDSFKVAEIKNANVTPSIIAFYNAIQNGNKSQEQLRTKPTNMMLLDMYNDRIDFWDSVTRNTLGYYIDFAKILAPSFIGGFYASFYEANELMVDSFFAQLCRGESISNGTLLVLRNKLISDKTSLRKLPRGVKMAMIIKAWNCYVTGASVKILKFDAQREEFPSIINK